MLEVEIRHGFAAFSLDIAFTAPGGVTALFGRSGSGKTSVVNAIAGLLTPQAGRIALANRILFDSAARVNRAAHRRRIGYVFQDARLFPHLNMRANLLYGAPRGASPDKIADLLGIAALLGRRSGDLSGGERQRVAIGRALLSAPDLLLMDEPLASLDETRKAEIIPYLERLRDETQVPIVYVSHSLPEIARLATTVVAIEGGRVIRTGAAADVLADPEAVPTLGVRDAGAVIVATVMRHDDDGLSTLTFSGGGLTLPRVSAPVGVQIRLRIEAQDVTLALSPPQGISALNILPVTITAIREGEGPGAAVALHCGQDRLLARITARSVRALGLRSGMTCYAIVKAMSIARRDIGG